MSATALGRSDEALRPLRFAPSQLTGRSAPSTSWRAFLSDRWSLSRTALRAAAKRPRSLTGSNDRKSCFQEVDGAPNGSAGILRCPTGSSWPGLTRPSTRLGWRPRRTLRAAGRARCQQSLRDEAAGVATWMAGSSPAMTRGGSAR
jgi:hypothetical protein